MVKRFKRIKTYRKSVLCSTILLSDTYLCDAHKPEVRFLEVEGRMPISCHEKIRRHQKTDWIIDARYLRGTEIMIDQDSNWFEVQNISRKPKKSETYFASSLSTRQSGRGLSNPNLYPRA